MTAFTFQNIFLAVCNLVICYHFFRTKNGILRKLFIAHFFFLATYAAFQIFGIQNVWTGLPRSVTALMIAVYIAKNYKKPGKIYAIFSELLTLCKTHFRIK